MTAPKASTARIMKILSKPKTASPAMITQAQKRVATAEIKVAEINIERAKIAAAAEKILARFSSRTAEIEADRDKARAELAHVRGLRRSLQGLAAATA